VVRHISRRVAVMYLGGIVEIADRSDLYHAPAHPYTETLLSAVPIPDPELEIARERCTIRGEVPSLFNTPSGCAFHPRCPVAQGICRKIRPGFKPIGGSAHMVACHLRA
jgi:oligopeptide/dipeptide ABC transporter ATP-binding protein